jgi:hypothetical protein
MFLRKYNLIKNVEIKTLKKLKNLKSEEKIHIKCVIRIDNRNISNRHKYNIVLILNNIKKSRSQMIQEEDIAKNIRQNSFLDRNISNQITLSKSLYVKNSRSINEIYFDVIIDKNNFDIDDDSLFYNKNILNLDVIVETSEMEVIDAKTNLNFNVLDAEIYNIKDNYVYTESLRSNIKEYQGLLKSIKLFKSYNCKNWLVIEGFDFKDKILNGDYSIRISQILQKSEIRVIKTNNFESLDLNIEDIVLLSRKDYDVEELIKSKYYHFIINILRNSTDTNIKIEIIDKKTNNSIESIKSSIKKEIIDNFFQKIFFEKYLPKFFSDKLKCVLVNSNNFTYKITFDKDSSFEEYPFFNLLMSKFNSLLEIRLRKIYSSNSKLIKKDININFIDSKKNNITINSKEGFFGYEKIFSNNNPTLYFNSSFGKEVECFLNIDFMMKNFYSRYRFKSAKTKIEKDLSYSNKENLSDSFPTNNLFSEISTSAIKIFKDNIVVDFNDFNAITAFLNYEPLNKKEMYNYLEYEDFYEFLESILLNVSLDILVSDKKIASYENTYFLKEYLQEDKSILVSKNLIDLKSKKLRIHVKNYREILQNYNYIKLSYCIKPALVRKQIYDNIGKSISNSVKSKIFKDSFDINSNQNFTFIENQVTIIHSSSSLSDIKKSMFNILYDENKSYINTLSVKI